MTKNSFDLYLDNILLTYVESVYSGGEVNVLIPELGTYTPENPNIEVTIVGNVNTSHKFMVLANLKDAITRMLSKYNKKVLVFLVTPYIPYGRQDRVCHEGESFSLEVFSSLLNSLKFTVVYTFDTHSPVSAYLIDALYVVEQKTFVEAIMDIEQYHLVYPDAGASLKVSEELGSYTVCSKVRVDGNPTVSLPDSFDTGTKSAILVVDDICDGGRTFISVAEKIKEKSDLPIDLYITHGIFSYGVDKLFEYFRKIYVTNNMSQISHPNLIQLKNIGE